MKSTVIFILLLTSSFLNIGLAQNNIDLNTLPSVDDLIVIRSNPSADTIIIGMHGGPTDMLYPGDFDFFENISTFSVVEVMQYQHYNPSAVTNSALTLDEAIMMNDTTVAMMRKVVNHYNDMNKTVVLIGHSFGGFLLPEYLDDYGIDDIHRVIPMAGRMNMNQEVVDAFATGYFAGFINGETVVVESQQADPEEWAAMKLQAGVGYNRYVDSLGSMDLSKLMYVYGTHDEAVGRLLPDEIAMLEATSASIVAVQNGSHDSPFFTPQMNQVLDFIRSDQMVATDDILVADVELYPTIIENNLTIDAANSGLLRILGASGQVVYQQNQTSGRNEISLRDFPAGHYVAQFITSNQKIKIEKLIIQ